MSRGHQAKGIGCSVCVLICTYRKRWIESEKEGERRREVEKEEREEEGERKRGRERDRQRERERRQRFTYVGRPIDVQSAAVLQEVQSRDSP